MTVKLPPLPEARKPDENGAGWFTSGQLAEVQREAYLAALDAAIDKVALHGGSVEIEAAIRALSAPQPAAPAHGKLFWEEEEALRYCKNADYWRARAEAAEEANETNARLASNYIELTCGGPLDPMGEAMRAGDGTLHGAIAYWQGQAEALRKDAECWRWLVKEHQRHDPICHLMWKRQGIRDSSEWVNTAEITASVVAAMENTK